MIARTHARLFRSIILCTLFAMHGQIYVSAADEPVNVSKAQLDHAIVEAQRWQTKARDVGFEWTTMDPLIQKAQQLAEQGHLEQAMAAATEAQLHGQLAVKQAAHAASNWHLETP